MHSLGVNCLSGDQAGKSHGPTGCTKYPHGQVSLLGLTPASQGVYRAIQGR